RRPRGRRLPEIRVASTWGSHSSGPPHALSCRGIDIRIACLLIGEESAMPDLLVRIVPKEGGGSTFDPGSLAAPQFAGVGSEHATGINHQIRMSDGSFETEGILPGQGSRPLYVCEPPEGTTIPYACALHPDEVGSIFVAAVQNLNA